MKKSNYHTNSFKNPLKALILIVAIAFTSVTVNAQYDIVWENPVNVTINGNSITKTSGGAIYDAGAESANKLSACSDGWVEFTSNVNDYKYVGLSANCSWNVSTFPTDITLGFIFRVGPSPSFTPEFTYLIDGIVQSAGWGPYSLGDTFKIERVGNQVTLTKNGIGGTYTFSTAVVSDWCFVGTSLNPGIGSDISNATASFGASNSCNVDIWARDANTESIYNLAYNDKIGLSTSSPTEKLDINGSLRVRTTAQDNSLTKFAVLDGNGVLKYRDNLNLNPFGGWYRQGTTDMPTAITDDIYTRGNIGVGLSNPSEAIDVFGREVKLRLEDNGGAGFASSTAVVLENSNGSWSLSGPRSYEINNNFGIWWNNGPWRRCFTITDDARFLMADNSNPSLIGTFRLYVNGNAFINGVWTTSDKRLKNNINKIEGSLSIISKLSGYNYSFNDVPDSVVSLPEGRQYGLLAQELKEVMPEAVKLNNNGYYAVNYEMVIPVLLEGIKEQQTTIETQNTKIEKLENEMEEIKSLLKEQGSLPKNIESSVSNYINLHPNPTYTKTTVSYSIAETYTAAQLIVYNELGQKVAEYVLSQKGNGNIDVDATTFKGGTYFCNLIVDGTIKEVKKFIVSK